MFSRESGTALLNVHAGIYQWWHCITSPDAEKGRGIGEARSEGWLKLFVKNVIWVLGPREGRDGHAKMLGSVQSASTTENKTCKFVGRNADGTGQRNKCQG